MVLEKSRDWMSFFRLPGASSALTGCLTGYLINTHEPVWMDGILLCLSSVFLYSSGMGFNDLVDLEKDRQLRPERPLPAGRIGTPSAKILCWLLMSLALGLTAFVGYDRLISACALALSIAVYNIALKHTRLAGLSIGLCRVFNFILGAGWVFLFWHTTIPLIAMFFHVQSVMAMAEGEDVEDQTLSRKFYIYTAIVSVALGWIEIWLGVIWLLIIAVILGTLKDDSRKEKIKAVGWLVLIFSLLDALVLTGIQSYTSAMVCVMLFCLSLVAGKVIKVG